MKDMKGTGFGSNHGSTGTSKWLESGSLFHSILVYNRISYFSVYIYMPLPKVALMVQTSHPQVIGLVQGNPFPMTCLDPWGFKSE